MPITPKARRKLVVTLVAIPTVLLAALVVALRGGDGAKNDAVLPTSPVPVTSDAPQLTGDEKARTANGAKSTAAKYAELLGGESMFNPDARHQLVRSIADPSVVAQLQQGMDEDYTEAFNRQLGLDREGRPAPGQMFVSRTTVAGTTVQKFSDTAATVTVWCSGLLSRTGDNPIPATSNWMTMTLRLSWSPAGWKLVEVSQQPGPTPAPPSPAQ